MLECCKLQKVEVNYGYIGSPLFDRQVGVVVNRNLSGFTDWARTEQGFALMHYGERVFVEIAPTGMVANIESLELSHTDLQEFFTDMCGLAGECIKEFGFSGFTNVSVNYLFLIDGDDVDLTRKEILGKMFSFPDLVIESTTFDCVNDFWGGITFSPSEKLKCDFSFSQYDKRNINRTFISNLHEQSTEIIVALVSFRSMGRMKDFEGRLKGWLSETFERSSEMMLRFPWDM
jgi:hypothetical protein